MSQEQTEITYSSALTELDAIVKEIEGETVSVDELTDKVKRATFLISFCKERLRLTEEQVGKILQAPTEDTPSATQT
jgi:exodeoxyribonuclease VII small subunit